MQEQGTISLAPEVVTQMSVEFAKLINDKGLVLVDEHLGQLAATIIKEQKLVLAKQDWFTAHEVKKYHFLGYNVSVNTIKKRVLDHGKPSTDYCYQQRESQNVLMISKRFVMRYNKEVV